MMINKDKKSDKLTRRKFLGAIGKGAFAFGIPSVLGVHAARAQRS